MIRHLRKTHCSAWQIHLKTTCPTRRHGGGSLGKHASPQLQQWRKLRSSGSIDMFQVSGFLQTHLCGDTQGNKLRFQTPKNTMGLGMVDTVFEICLDNKWDFYLKNTKGVLLVVFGFLLPWQCTLNKGNFGRHGLFSLTAPVAQEVGAGI